MKLPQNINIEFYKSMVNSGWDEDRKPLIQKLPAGLEDLPEEVKSFVKTLWWITLCREHYFYCDRDREIAYRSYLYYFGEIERILPNFSLENDFNHYWIEHSQMQLRCFGMTRMNPICIDQYGRIYEIDNELYYCDGTFYQGLYNLIYGKGRLFMVEEKGQLIEIDKTTRKRRKVKFSLHDIPGQSD